MSESFLKKKGLLFRIIYSKRFDSAHCNGGGGNLLREILDKTLENYRPNCLFVINSGVPIFLQFDLPYLYPRESQSKSHFIANYNLDYHFSRRRLALTNLTIQARFDFFQAKFIWKFHWVFSSISHQIISLNIQ